jgi:hypothetical protein
MHSFKHLRRLAVLAVGLASAGVLLAFGGTPAFATDSLVQIYGSGAALQNQLQNDILIPDSPLTTTPIYTQTTSGSGAAEFGLETGSLNLTEDPTADKLSTPQLDAYVGVDSPPSSTELSNADTASGSDLVTVPVAQTALAIPASLPVGLLLNSSQSLKLKSLLLGQLFAGTIPAQGGYSANTWGALLIELGLTKITTGSPSVGQFLDSGGGTTTISVETRKNGAGTTLNLKQYVASVDATDWSGITVDENAYGTNEWPSGATITASPGNSTDAAEASAVANNPGQVGYATAGDAVSAGFLLLPLLLTVASKEFQSFWFGLQDNGTKETGTVVYANPVSGSASNVYTGSSSSVGTWDPPGSPWDGTWAGSDASDDNVYNDAGEEVAYYPLVAVAYDLAWLNYAASGLSSDYPAPLNAGYTAQQFLEFATGSTGQSDIESSSYYYAELPSSVLTDAQDAAAAVYSG